jgi:hypothetical protein
MRVGVVGYSAQKFDNDEAIGLLNQALSEAVSLCLSKDLYQVDWKEEITIVSGLTDLGIPAIAYEFAMVNGAPTMGIACAKAKEYECFPCDRVHIVGENWGDESESFLAAIDVLIRIGGGKQSLAECDRAKDLGIAVFEKELSAK